MFSNDTTSSVAYYCRLVNRDTYNFPEQLCVDNTSEVSSTLFVEIYASRPVEPFMNLGELNTNVLRYNQTTARSLSLDRKMIPSSQDCAGER